MKHKLYCDTEKCSACAACVIACMDQNDFKAHGNATPRRRVLVSEHENNGEVVYASVSCLHCKDAACVKGCPSGSLYKDAKTGLTLYDKKRCTGCHKCASLCPNSALCFDPDGKIDKCDGCYARLLSGLDPACIRACPVGALELGSALSP